MVLQIVSSNNRLGGSGHQSSKSDMGSHCRYSGGFTLLELLLAITIFAIISTFMYAGLKVVLDTEQHTTRYNQRITKLQLGFNLIQRDIIQLTDRKIRDQHGDHQAALYSGGLSGVLLELTRGGHANPMNLPRSNLQRIGYQLEEETLYRYTWRVLDRAQDSEPNKFKIIEGITSLEMIYYDKDLNKLNQWPPEIRGSEPDEEPPLPVAIEINLELEDMGEIRRIFPVVSRLPSTETQQTQQTQQTQ
jgi:general secretion pathway protein J